jgi:DNA-binding NtrC family response regulator
METNIQKKECILVVDDEVATRESLRMILSPFYEVYVAADAKEALRCIIANDIDLATLDLNLPGLSGIDTLKEIKELKPRIKVIIITAYGSLENAQDANRLGADGFISKPFNVADVIAILGKCMERKALDRKVESIMAKIQCLRSSTPPVSNSPKSPSL